MAALRYAPSEASSLCLSYGRGFETPTLNELSYRADGRSGLNFALQPALSDHVEAGTKWPTSIGLLPAAVFRSQTQDELVPARAAERRVGKECFRTSRYGWSPEH